MQERLRVVPRPPKGASITVAQAKRAFLKVERESAAKRASRSAETGRVAEKDSATADAKPSKRASSTKKKP